MEEGIIYVLTNPAMPNMVKIGKTTRAEVEIRMNELYSTGVPLPFVCSFAGRFNDLSKVERAFHTAFAPSRVNPNREFFEIEDSQAIAILKLMCDEDITPSISEEFDKVDEVSKDASVNYIRKRPRFDFEEMGIPVGATLRSTVDDQNCTIVNNNKVAYNGEEMSLSNATKIVLGIDYAVRPIPHWTYEGKTLSEYYKETYV